jgi:D-3-phosphoglycerate dehydrogenase
MKPTAYLINVSRGGVVDERALVEALDEGRLAGAALDVFREEPTASPHPLVDHPLVVPTPHLAGSTAESLRRIAMMAGSDIRRVFDGRVPQHAVNPL